MCNDEVKMVFLNKKFSHFSVDGKNRAVKLSLQGYDRDELINFGLQVIQKVEERSNNACIVDGLFRVDVFKGNNGSLVVNELETMDLEYFSRVEQNPLSVLMFLQYYWEKKIYDCITGLFAEESDSLIDF